MPIQILPQGLPGLGQTLAENFGQGFNTGLQPILQQLAQSRAQQMQAQRTGSALQALLPNLSPEQAQAAAYAPESILKELVKNQLGAPERQAFGQMLSQVLGQEPNEQQANNQRSTSQLGPIKPEISPQRALELAKLSETRRASDIAQQSQTLKRWDKFADQIEEKAKPARQVVHAAKEALDLLKTQKAITGLAGKITPEYLQSAEGQALISKLKQIVTLRAQLGKGVPSRARLILEEGSKAQIWQQPKAIEKILNDTVNDPEIQKDIAEGNSIEQINTQYAEKIPKDFRKVFTEQTKSALRSKEGYDDLEDAKNEARKLGIKTIIDQETGQTINVD